MYRIIKDCKDRCGRIYSLKELSEQAWNLIENKSFFATFGNNSSILELDKITHIVTFFSVDEKDAYVNLKNLETPNNKIVEDFLNCGIIMRPGILGVGEVDGTRKVTNYTLSCLSWNEVTKDLAW